jgi:hypothetical protein
MAVVRLSHIQSASKRSKSAAAFFDATGAGSISDEPDIDGLRSLAAFDHVDGYPLAFRQIGVRKVPMCRSSMMSMSPRR